MNRLFRLMTLLVFTLPAPSAWAYVGYGSSDAVYSAKNQEFFFMGFAMGLEDSVKEALRKPTLANLKSVQASDGKQLSALRVARELLSSDVAALVGFPTSHEALLVSDLVKRQDIIFLSAAAAHSDMSEKGQRVFTLGESVMESKKVLIKFVQKTLPRKKGLLLINERDVFSVNQSDTLKKVNAAVKNPIQLVDGIAQGNVISEQDLQKIKSGEYGYIVLTTYADDSTQILEQIDQLKITVPIIANSSWTIGNIERVRRALINVKAPVYCVASVVKGLPSATAFEKKYVNKYGKPPETEMYYGYDLGQIVGQTLNRINSKPTRKSFTKAFLHDLCFENTTTGRLCFPGEGGHAVRDIHWLRFSPKNGNFLLTNFSIGLEN